MASGLASAAMHQIPAMSLPAVPRVRPPRMPKGTPQGNSLPQPSGTVPSGLVWADGKWRQPDSRSAKQKQEVQSRQVEKALKHETHGMNIYAYSHIRTNQVVYSLTKVMENNKILPQLLFHGKQTVPEALRRDVWRPYFSIHFPGTPAGASKGLRVYRDLRELALRRQLEPPTDLVIATQEDLQKAKDVMDPIQLKEALERRRRHKYKLPIVGQKLPKDERARRLMNQKGSSVADVAAVLSRHDKQGSPQMVLKRSEKRRKAREELLSNRGRIRLRAIRQREEREAEKNEVRQELVDNENLGQVALARDAGRRISMEYEGAINSGKVTSLETLERQKQETERAAGASIRFATLIRNMQLEKDLAKEAIQKEMTAEVVQRLSALSPEERLKIDKQMDQEKASAQERYEALRTELDNKLENSRSQTREAVEADTEKLKTALGGERTSLKKQLKENRKAYRKLQRERSLALLKLSQQRKADQLYVGPYTEIRTKIDEMTKQIEKKYLPELNNLRKEMKVEAEVPQNTVEIRWADIRAATYAQEWPESVFHESLQPRSAVKTQGNRIQTHAFIDENENEILEQLRPTKIQIGSSVHVFGSAQPEENDKHGWYLSPRELEAIYNAERADREAAWESTEAVLARKEIVRLREETHKLAPADSVSISEEESENGVALLNALESAKASLSTSGDQNGESPAEFDGWINYVRTLISELRAESETMKVESSSKLELGAASKESLRLRISRLIEYAEALIKQLEFEYKHINIRSAADRQEEWEHQLAERKSLLEILSRSKTSSITEDSEKAEQRLRDFDGEHPDAARLEQRKEELQEILQERTQEIQNAEQDIVKASNAVNDAVAALEAKKIAGPSDKEALSSLENAVETARDNVSFAQDIVRDLQEQQTEDQEMLNNADHEAWLEFKRDGGFDTLPSTRPGGNLSLKDMQVEVPSEQQKGKSLWARIKSIIGR